MTERLVLARDRIELGRYDAVRTGQARRSLTRLRWGAYADATQVQQLNEADRYALQVLAAMSVRRHPVAAGISAAVLYGLPLVGFAPKDVYLLGPGTSGRRRNGVVELPRHGSERVASGEPSMTELADTLIEVCRTAPFLTALTMVDHAINIDRRGVHPSMTSMEALFAAHNSRMPYRGSARVAGVLSFASTGAESPFETLSRVTVTELGFPEPAVQYHLELPGGKDSYSDFAWEEFRVTGEADGWGKYVDPRYPAAGSIEERVRAEKRRDNALRRIQWTPAHWEWNDAWQREPLKAILLDAGLPLVRPRRTLR